MVMMLGARVCVGWRAYVAEAADTEPAGGRSKRPRGVFPFEWVEAVSVPLRGLPCRWSHPYEVGVLRWRLRGST